MRRRILVTRSEEDCRELQALVKGAGIQVLPYPVLSFEPVRDEAGLEAVRRRLSGDGWLLFASKRAISPFRREARDHGLEPVLRWPAATVGSGTADTARREGLRVEVVGPGTGRGLAEELLHRLKNPTTLLFACGEDHRPELPTLLTKAGHRVLKVIVYRMRPSGRDRLHLPETPIEGVVLTSPRSARYYLESLDGQALACPHWALGPTTRDAAAGLGIECRMPARPSLESLAEELCAI